MDFRHRQKDACWYVVYTKRRQEFRALEQLQNQEYTCYLPTLEMQRIYRGKSETTIEPLFARYLFIQLNSVIINWTRVCSTRGVTRLVTFGSQPAMLPGEFVDALKRVPHIARHELFQPGERVAINSGPFAGHEGVYQAPHGEARALILVELMSQPRKLKLAVEMLSKAA